MFPTRWITLPPEWKLQDVQAGLNVIIAFLCAAAVFVLVRHFWVVAARRVTRRKDVPAYQLLSLNTVGETIDVVWLLRRDLFSSRYRGLLVQCIFVLTLTLCTIGSGYIARFSTRSTITKVEREVNGSLARRNTGSLIYDVLEINSVVEDMKKTGFPQDQLAEFWPNPASGWAFNNEQWNNSWSMQCKYNTTTEVPNTRTTGNCTYGLYTEWPWIGDNWWDWSKDTHLNYSDYTYDWISWRREPGIRADTLLFVHGVETPDSDSDDKLNTDFRMRTVCIHLKNATEPKNASSTCAFDEGPIEAAAYTSATCTLHRELGNRSTDDLDMWGAYPDAFNIIDMASVYSQLYSSKLRRQSTNYLPVEPIDAQELAMVYQAYLVVKDTGGSLYHNVTGPNFPQVWRTLDVRVKAAQVSFTCIVVCSILALIVLCGLVNYWFFLLVHWNRLDQTPQSKLDWMLQTLRQEDESANSKVRHRLSTTMASGVPRGEAVPLTNLDQSVNDGRSYKSMATSISSMHDIQSTPDPFDTPILGSDYSGQTLASRSMWSPPMPQPISPTKFRSMRSPPIRHYQQLDSRSSYGGIQEDMSYDSGRT